MSEIMNQAICDLGEILLDANAEPSKVENAIRRILSTKTLATVYRGIEHWSDCSVYNEPAYPTGECDCW